MRSPAYIPAWLRSTVRVGVALKPPEPRGTRSSLSPSFSLLRYGCCLSLPSSPSLLRRCLCLPLPAFPVVCSRVLRPRPHASPSADEGRFRVNWTAVGASQRHLLSARHRKRHTRRERRRGGERGALDDDDSHGEVLSLDLLASTAVRFARVSHVSRESPRVVESTSLNHRTRLRRSEHGRFALRKKTCLTESALFILLSCAVVCRHTDTLDMSEAQPSLQQQLASYDKLGYLILPGCLSPTALMHLRRECDRLSNTQHSSSDGAGDSDGDHDAWHEQGFVVETMQSGSVSEQAWARFCPRAYTDARLESIRQRCTAASGSAEAEGMVEDNAAACDVLFRHAPLLRVVAAILAHLGRRQSVEPTSDASPSCWLFNEQYVVKPPRSTEAEFGWHTDRGEQLALYSSPAARTPYLACWCALDDMREENGTLRMVNEPELREWQAQQSSASSDAGPTASPIPAAEWLASHSTPVVVPAGSVVLFDGDVWHASSGNRSDQPRRVLYTQYSLKPIGDRLPDDEASTEALCSSCGGSSCVAHSRTWAPLSFAIPCVLS